jgi:hypothetical protein
MPVHRSRTTLVLWSSVLIVGGAVQLTACGGGDPSATDTTAAPGPAIASTTGSGMARRPAPRHATLDQLAMEELLVAPYTLVLDIDDEAAAASALQHVEAVRAFGGNPSQLGIFVRSPHAALADRLATHLAIEQGFHRVFVVR